MLHKVQYHNDATSEDSDRAPSYPVFLENVWVSTRIEQDSVGKDYEVKLIQVDYEPFKYADL